MGADAENPLVTAIKGGDAAALKGAGDAAAKLQDGGGRSGLSLAAALGSKEVVQALLDEGAADATAAGQAAFSGHADALALLLAAGGAEAATAADPLSGLTPLQLAALKGHASCAAQLLDAAPDAVEVTDGTGRTPLMLAATGGSVDTVKLLASRGAKLDAQSKDGRTALIWAVVAHKPLAVAALAELGADPELTEYEADGVVRPGVEAKPKSALDHAVARQGKDPINTELAKWLRAWLELRAEGGKAAPPPPMEEPPWITHARNLKPEEEAEPVQEVSTGGGDANDIWGDEDEAPAEAPAIEELPPAEEAPAVAAEGFTPCAAFDGARPGQVFKKGHHGVGYYAEATAAPAPVEAPAPAAPAPAAKEEPAAAPAAPSNLEELD